MAKGKFMEDSTITCSVCTRIGHGHRRLLRYYEILDFIAEGVWNLLVRWCPCYEIFLFDDALAMKSSCLFVMICRRQEDFILRLLTSCLWQIMAKANQSMVWNQRFHRLLWGCRRQIKSNSYRRQIILRCAMPLDLLCYEFDDALALKSSMPMIWLRHDLICLRQPKARRFQTPSA